MQDRDVYTFDGRQGMKRAILVVSFGTSHSETCAKTIEVIEREIQGKYPEYLVYRAWTSEVIRRKVKARDGVRIFSVKEALKQMYEDGVKEIVVQPTFLIEGVESEKMLGELQDFVNVSTDAMGLMRVVVGKPLLTTQEDQNKVLDALLAEWQLQSDEFLLLMGHGSQNEANAVYEELNMLLEQRGCRNIRIGTLHEFEKSIRYIEQQDHLQKIILASFMIVSGSHAVHNMAGNQESSWKSRLEKAGFEVECVMKGLGEYQEIRNLIYSHLDTIVSEGV